MKKSTYVTMILGTIGTVVAALGMCMVLVPEWSLFQPGIWVGTMGIIILGSTWLLWRRLENKSRIHLSKKNDSFHSYVFIRLFMFWDRHVFGDGLESYYFWCIHRISGHAIINQPDTLY